LRDRLNIKALRPTVNPLDVLSADEQRGYKYLLFMRTFDTTKNAVIYVSYLHYLQSCDMRKIRPKNSWLSNLI
ncbi:MAG: hypothetical protein QNL11_09620, partial [Desulfobacterales bacterium]|nr:hypothetical protein [Desulfobacterales bacterium]